MSRSRLLRLLVPGGPIAAILIAWSTASVGSDGRNGLALANVALLLAVLTVGVALLDWVGGLTTSVAAALSLNWFHTEPVRTFRISSATDLVSVLLLAALGIGVSATTAARVRRAVHRGRAAATGAAQEALQRESAIARPAHELWQQALAATSSDLALVEARVVSAPGVDLPIVARLPWTDEASDAEFVLPLSGAAVPLGRANRQMLILTPQPGLGPLLLDRRAVTAFADAVQLALEP